MSPGGFHRWTARRAPRVGVACLLLLVAAPGWAQTAVERERADYVRWLTSAPTSPFATVAQQPIGRELRLGPANADIPLDGIGEHRVVAGAGGVRLESAAGGRPMPRGAPVRVGSYTLVADGPAGREVLTVFASRHSAKSPVYYDLSAELRFSGPLLPPERHGTVRVLGVDGIEVEAAEAGSVQVPFGGTVVRLRVLRIPSPGGEESELEIYFRDATNGHSTYPAGRFVSLSPAAGGRYRLDFNRARNPFCAYSSAYPCPAPWRGNTIPIAIDAGERYQGGGLSSPAGAR